MTTCSSCNAPIAWVRTQLGKPMPVDLERVRVLADSKGTTVIVTDSGRVVRGVKLQPVDGHLVNAVEGRVSHFASCPNAAAHRRRS